MADLRDPKTQADILFDHPTSRSEFAADRTRRSGADLRKQLQNLDSSPARAISRRVGGVNLKDERTQADILFDHATSRADLAADRQRRAAEAAKKPVGPFERPVFLPREEQQVPDDAEFPGEEIDAAARAIEAEADAAGDSEVDEQAREVFVKVVRERGIDERAAQAVFEDVAPLVQQRNAERWAAQSRADRDLMAGLDTAKQALREFASPKLIRLLEANGFANHPEVIRMFLKVGRAGAARPK